MLELYLFSLYIPSWHGHLYNFTFFMGPVISFCVAFTQNADFGECLLGPLLYADIILALYSVS